MLIGAVDRRLLARRLGGASGSRCRSPFFSRILKHFIGFRPLVWQWRLRRLLCGLLLNHLPHLVNRRAAHLQLAGSVGTTLTLTHALQQQQHLGGRELTAGKHGPNIKVVGLAAFATATRFEPTALHPAKEVSRFPTRLAAGIMEAVGMKVWLKPLLALLFVE